MVPNGFDLWSLGYAEELEHMFDMIDLKDTRYYQDVFNDGKEEGQEEGERQGKLHAVPLLVESGVSAERIARELGLSIEAVQEAARPAKVRLGGCDSLRQIP